MEKLYYDPSKGFLSASKLYQRLKEEGHPTPLQEVRAFLKRQATYQINKQPRRPRKYRTITAFYPRFSYQMDVMVYNRFAIDGYRYILCVIDVYSRYASARALTNLRQETLLAAIQDVFMEMGKPQNLNCDQEFVIPLLIKNWFANAGITVYASEPDELHKNAIVERFNGTLAGLLQRWRTGQASKKWYRVLPQILQNYNSTLHRTLHARPIDVWERRAIPLQSPIIRSQPSLEVGDQVRIRLVKSTFDKGDSVKYSHEVYVVSQKLSTHKYRIQNLRTLQVLKRAYKEGELQHITASEHAPLTNLPKRISAPARRELAALLPRQPGLRVRKPNQFHQEFIPFADD